MQSLHDLEPEQWSELQFGGCQLGDVRRTRRLVQYGRQMAEKPDASTPRQTESWAPCKGVYRLFACKEVTFDAVTECHYRQTLEMATGACLVISDTTDLDYGRHRGQKDLGRIGSGSRRGFYLHSALVVNADRGYVVGLGAQELFTRPLRKKQRVHRVGGRKRATESEVWGRVMDRVVPAQENVKLIHVCDRGADNFDVFAHLSVKGDSWVIRAAQLTRKVLHKQEQIKLAKVLETTPILGMYELYIPANGKRRARWANVEVRAAQVTLLRPREGSTNFVMDQDITTIDTNVVEVREIDAPAGDQPVRWVLYTREPATTYSQAIRCIEHYEKRPLVEEYHKCMKTGLGVEERRYQYSDRLAAVIGVICVQAVRLLILRDVSRRTPDAAARRYVPREWLTVIRRMRNHSRPITSVRDFMRALAGLGGFLGRKSDGEPGWQTIWRGLTTLLAALRGYRAARPRCG